MFSGYFLERAITATRSPCSCHTLALPCRSSQCRDQPRPVLWDAHPKLTTGFPKAWLSHLSQDTWLPFLHEVAQPPLFKPPLFMAFCSLSPSSPTAWHWESLQGRLLWKQQEKCLVYVTLELSFLYLSMRYLHVVQWIPCSCKVELPSFSPLEQSLKNCCFYTHGQLRLCPQ